MPQMMPLQWEILFLMSVYLVTTLNVVLFFNDMKKLNQDKNTYFFKSDKACSKWMW